MQERLAERLIDGVDWASYGLFSSDASGFGERLRAFINYQDLADWDGMWLLVENHVVAQGELFSAAKPTISVLFAALIEPMGRPVFAILDLLFRLVKIAFDDLTELTEECRAAAEAGVWLLAQIAQSGTPNERDACLEILALFPPSQVECVATALGGLGDW